MIFSSTPTLSKRKEADILVLPYWKGKKTAEHATAMGKLETFGALPIKAGDFSGKEGEVLILYTEWEQEKRVALLGLGEESEASVETLRRCTSSFAQSISDKKLKSVNILLPTHSSLKEEEVVRGVTEGVLLTNYSFDKLRKEEKSLLTKLNIIGASEKGLKVAKKYGKIAEAVYLTRDLVNGNAEDVTPQHLADVAKQFAKEFSNVKTTVFDKKRIEKEKMGLLLAVNKGSDKEPAFIICEYQGDPKSKEHTVLVGKGITYDTGGLNLKPTGSMETMRSDMGGSAAALGTMHAIANLGLKVNLTVVIPSTENSIGSKSYKPGDVFTSYLGKTVEIGNTDAEGRLVLADALAYVEKKLKPTRIIDFATLTGTVSVALGAEAAGLLSNNDSLAEELSQAGNATYERVWRLPLFEEYKKQLDSSIADIKNTGGRLAGTITGALFLQEFMGKTPWAHIDIAGTAYLTASRRYHPKMGSGIGVRLMVEFLENQK